MKINNSKGSISSGVMIVQFLHFFREKLEEELLQYQEKGTEANARTAELYSKQENTDFSEVVVIDEISAQFVMTQRKRKVILHMWSNAAGN